MYDDSAQLNVLFRFETSIVTKFQIYNQTNRDGLRIENFPPNATHYLRQTPIIKQSVANYITARTTESLINTFQTTRRRTIKG